MPLETPLRQRTGNYSKSALQRAQEETPKPKPRWRQFVDKILRESADELLVIVIATVGTLVRAMGVQVNSGYAGLLFTNGRASKVLDHGFRPLIPFLQQVAIVPIRSRTMDLPSQRIVNREGFVYHVDANLVYHVHDVRKAVIEIDVLEEGMLQMLTLGVQEVLRETTKETIGDTQALGERLEENLTKRLADWGVTVDKAGFPSLTPSPQTLRITQLDQQVSERKAQYDTLRERGSSSQRALAIVGTRRMPRPKRVTYVRSEFAKRNAKRMAVLRAKAMMKKEKRALIRIKKKLGNALLIEPPKPPQPSANKAKTQSTPGR